MPVSVSISIPLFALTSVLTICVAQTIQYSNRDTKTSRKKESRETKPTCIYLDYNATTPLYEEVGQVITNCITEAFGNPSSSHVYGLKSKEVVVQARQLVGQLVVAAKPQDSIIFTSCGTESDNRAIDLALHIFKSNPENKNKKPLILTCITEHPAVICYLRQLRIDDVATVTVLPVDSQGLVDAAKLEANFTAETALVTIMHSNNETGTMQPIRDISRRIRQYNATHKTNIIFHSDAAQSVGKVPIDVEALAVDMLTIVGHKMGAPKGVAALYIHHKYM